MKTLLTLFVLLFSSSVVAEMIICQVVEPGNFGSKIQIHEGDFDYYKIDENNNSISRYKRFETYDRSKEPKFNYYVPGIAEKIPRYIETDHREIYTEIPKIIYFSENEIIFMFYTVKEKLLKNKQIEDEKEELAKQNIFTINPYPKPSFCL